MANATSLANGATQLLPPTITNPIFNKATEQSAIMSLARRVPLSVSAQTAIPVSMDVPVADWVGEGGIKPGAQAGVGVKLMSGKKLALLLPVSDEIVMTNPGGLYEQMKQDLPTALSRAFDYAAINGKSLKTGGAGPFSDYIAMTPNSVALGTTAQGSGGIYADLVTGVGKVIDKNYDMTGWAADPRLLVDTMLATDTVGRPLLSAEHSTGTTDAAGGPGDVSANGRDLLGWPVQFNKGISGRYWRAGDSLQTLTITGTPTGGTFIVAAGGNSYQAAYNVSTAALQNAIQAWGGIFATVTVTGTAGSSYVITFPAITSNIAPAAAPFQANGAGLTGGTSPKASVVSSGNSGGVDSTIRAVAGDWTQAAYGVGMDITIKISNEASYFDGTSFHSAFQENLTLLLVEAYYGFVIGDPNAFCVLTKGSAAF